VRLRLIIVRLLAAGILIPAAGTPGTPAQAAPAPPGNGLRFRLVDAPVKARPDSRAWRYIIDHLTQGSVIHRRVEVSNTTGSPMRVSVYAAAAQISDRQFMFAPGRTPNELSTWTTTSRNELTLAPRTHSMVMTTIAVPDKAAPGERYAVIWAEATKAAPPGGGIAIANRVGVRIYLSVGRNSPPAAFTIDTLTAQRSPNGLPVVLAQVHNTGGRALDLSGDLRLRNGSGNLNAGPFKVQTGTTLAPGDSGPITVTINEQMSDGPWHARIRLESGLTKGAAEATITFPSAPGTATAVKAEADTSHYAMAALIIGGMLSALVAARALLIRRRRSLSAD
jgi:hypothetical protein